MSSDPGEREEWYKRLCPDQTPAARQALAKKAGSHRVAIEHFQPDGLYWTNTGQLRKTALAFPSRTPNSLPPDVQWATSKHPNKQLSQRDRRRQETSALNAAESPVLTHMRRERDRLFKENAQLQAQVERLAAEAEVVDEGAEEVEFAANQQAIEDALVDTGRGVLSHKAFVDSQFLQSRSASGQVSARLRSRWHTSISSISMGLLSA